MKRLLFGALVLASCPQALAAAEYEPTYADVLARPDDAGVNLGYARRLVREGHINSASATLERVLLTHPEADDIRLMYMIVLYRLDDITGAKRESDILAQRSLPPALVGEYNRYASRIAARAKPTRFTAYLGSGLRADSDATYLPDANGVNRHDADVSYISMAGVGVEHSVDLPLIDKVFAQLDVGSTTHARESAYNLVTGRAEAGTETRFGGLVLRLSAFGSASLVDWDPFGREAGGRARATYEINGQWKIFAEAEGARQSYSDIKIGQNEVLHNGYRSRYGGGVIFQATDAHQFTVQAHYGVKSAEARRYSYDVADIEAKWLGTFRGGQYMTVGGIYANYDYAAQDVDYGVTRQDRYWRVRASYGLPVRTLGSWVGFDTSSSFFTFGDLVLQTSIDYTRQDSNIGDFDRRNLGGEVLLTRRFEF